MRSLVLVSLISLGSLYADNFQGPLEMCCSKNYPTFSRIDPECSYAHLFIEGDPLYWKVTDDNLYFAVSGYNPLPNPSNRHTGNSTNFNGRIVRVDPDWDWGFHLALGGNLPTDEWDLRIDWTRFHTEHSHAEGDPTSVFGNLWATSDQTPSDASSFVKGDYHLRYDLVELNLGRYFWAGDRLSLHPSIGVRGGRVDQKLIIDYTVFTIGSASGNKTPFSGGAEVDIFSKSRFQGGGLGAGIDADFDLYSGLAILAKFKVHALYGEYHNKFLENSQEPDISPLIASENDHYHESLIGTDVALGLSWNRTFSDERFNLELHAMWQQVTWFAANQMDHWTHQFFDNDMNKFNSNLGLQGITFGASVHF